MCGPAASEPAEVDRHARSVYLSARRHGNTPSSSISIEKLRNVRTRTITPSAMALSSVGSIVIVWTMSAMIRISCPSRRSADTQPDALVGLEGMTAEQRGHEPRESENRADDEYHDPSDLEPSDDVLHCVFESRRADHPSPSPGPRSVGAPDAQVVVAAPAAIVHEVYDAVFEVGDDSSGEDVDRTNDDGDRRQRGAQGPLRRSAHGSPCGAGSRRLAADGLPRIKP
jgi:hypothetical protein